MRAGDGREVCGYLLLRVRVESTGSRSGDCTSTPHASQIISGQLVYPPCASNEFSGGGIELIERLFEIGMRRARPEPVRSNETLGRSRC